MSITVLTGVIRGKTIELEQESELPDGQRVTVRVELEEPPLKASAGSGAAASMREEEWPTTPEGIAALLVRMDKVEPGWLSPEDDAGWRAALRAQKNAEKARFFEDAEKSRRMWE